MSIECTYYIRERHKHTRIKEDREIGEVDGLRVELSTLDNI